jgi:hypothetical protein
MLLATQESLSLVLLVSDRAHPGDFNTAAPWTAARRVSLPQPIGPLFWPLSAKEILLHETMSSFPPRGLSGFPGESLRRRRRQGVRWMNGTQVEADSR